MDEYTMTWSDAAREAATAAALETGTWAPVRTAKATRSGALALARSAAATRAWLDRLGTNALPAPSTRAVVEGEPA